MAHELTFRNGVAQVFSTRLPMWHQEGHLLEEAPDYNTAIELAGLGYNVEVRPLYLARPGVRQAPEWQCTRCEERHLPDAAGDVLEECPSCGNADMVLREGAVAGHVEYAESRFGRVIVRSDDGTELGTVGRTYTPLQNRDAFRVLEPLLDAGVARLETGGSLREGADAWLMVRFDTERFGPVVREIFADEVIPYGLIANNHDGRRGVLLQLTPIRVVCANTLAAAEGHARGGRAITVKHTKSVASATVAAAQKLFQGLIERYEVVAQQYQTLKQVTLTEEAFRELVTDVVAPDPRTDPSFNPEAKLAGLVLERAERRRARVRELWESGRGHTGDHSGWEAFNAAAEALDHEAELWPHRSGCYRTASLLDGRLGETKVQVVNGLVRYARAGA